MDRILIAVDRNEPPRFSCSNFYSYEGNTENRIITYTLVLFLLKILSYHHPLFLLHSISAVVIE